MRLLHAPTLKFQEFFDESSFPPYAILSHTWAAGEEITLQDMSSPYLPTKKGYAKITETCRLALAHGLEYAWVDTCCIDKTSSAELTESINSMFRWYQKARICFVYLSDMHAASMSAKAELAQCAWFTRGWTLQVKAVYLSCYFNGIAYNDSQELLAPRKIQFYNSQWACIGIKGHFDKDLSSITGIPVMAIQGTMRVGNFSVAQRMSWASKRVTTREEDISYCLLGLFDVHMPLIYGEGTKAFFRLQEEISKRTNDMTLFAWVPTTSPSSRYCSVLASSPSDYAGSGNIVRGSSDQDSEYSLTNKGVKMTTHPVFEPLSPAEPGPWSDCKTYRSILLVGSVSSSTRLSPLCYDTRRHIGIYIEMLGPGVFVRETNPLLCDKSNGIFIWERTHTFHFLQAPGDELLLIKYRLQSRIRIPSFALDNIKMQRGYSLTYWDLRQRICYAPRSDHEVIVFSFKASLGGRELNFAVLFQFNNDSGGVIFRLIDKRTLSSRLLFLFCARDMDKPMRWPTIEDELPDIMKLSDRLRVDVDGVAFNITASTKWKTAVIGSQPITFPTLDIQVVELSDARAVVHGEHGMEVDDRIAMS